MHQQVNPFCVQWSQGRIHNLGAMWLSYSEIWEQRPSETTQSSEWAFAVTSNHVIAFQSCISLFFFSKCEKESINKLSLNGTWRFHFESSTINSPKSTSLHLPAEGWFSPPASILICDLTCHYIDSCPRWSTFVLSNKASDKSKRLRKRPGGTTIPMYSSEKSYALKVGAAATAI